MQITPTGAFEDCPACGAEAEWDGTAYLDKNRLFAQFVCPLCRNIFGLYDLLMVGLYTQLLLEHLLPNDHAVNGLRWLMTRYLKRRRFSLKRSVA